MINRLEICKKFAITKHEGLCLATKYIHSKSKMLWQCSEGHQWEASYNSVISHNTWCIICAGKQKHTIENIRKFIQTLGYELISTKYENQYAKLEVKCNKGHIFYPTFTNLKSRNSKCPHCVSLKNGLNQRLSFEEVKEFIESIGYKLISTEYNGIHIPLEVMCNKGHIFYPEFNVLKSQGSRCPQCSSGKHEKECREILEKIFKTSFPLYPFKDEYGQKFIWDGYNEELKIAFEYHGYQHYEFPNRFHKTKEDFLNAQTRDYLKEEYAIKNRIKLLVIPDTENKNLEEYINELILGKSEGV